VWPEFILSSTMSNPDSKLRRTWTSWQVQVIKSWTRSGFQKVLVSNVDIVTDLRSHFCPYLFWAARCARRAECPSCWSPHYNKSQSRPRFTRRYFSTVLGGVFSLGLVLSHGYVASVFGGSGFSKMTCHKFRETRVSSSTSRHEQLSDGRSWRDSGLPKFVILSPGQIFFDGPVRFC